MLGRGMVSDPGLALAIRAGAGPGVAWSTLQPLMADFWRRIGPAIAPRHRAGRPKQLLNMLRRHFPEAQLAWEQIRTVNEPALVGTLLFGRDAADPVQDAKALVTSA